MEIEFDRFDDYRTGFGGCYGEGYYACLVWFQDDLRQCFCCEVVRICCDPDICEGERTIQGVCSYKLYVELTWNQPRNMR